MAARSIWKGHLKLSLVAVPVKAYTSSVTGAEVHLNQLHAKCKSRIKYLKSCPVHGEVKADDIVSGYEFAKVQYVVIDPEELDKLRTEDDKAIRIATFIKPEALDPMCGAGKTYYVLPDGPAARQPYAVFHKAMVESERVALAQLVFHGREQLFLLRPAGKLFAMTVLHLEDEITKPGAFEGEVGEAKVPADEVKLATTLIQSLVAEKLDYAKFKDVYMDRLKELIHAKVEGKAIVAAPAPVHVASLMDALRQSVAAAQANGEQKPPKKMAASTAAKKPAAKRKKA